MNYGALSDLKVIEYAHLVSGPFCAKLMADLGAEVIKVEDPKLADEARRKGPFLDSVPHSETSGLFLYLNTNKLGITLNLKSATGRKIFKELIERADILVENNPPSLMHELDLDYETLQKINPQLIVTSITPFGQTGPYRDYKSCDLVSFHIGGMGWVTPDWVKNPTLEPPLKGGGRQADFMTGITAALATMSAIFARQSSKPGQHIDLSEQESVVYALSRSIAMHFSEKLDYRRARTPTMERPIACKDGYVELHVVEDAHWQAFKKIVRLEELASDRFKDYYARCQNWDDLESLLLQWTMEHTKEEIYHTMQAQHIAAAPVNTARDLLASRHFAERDYFVEVDHPEAGKITYPGTPCTLSQTPQQVNCPAPLLGQHNEEVLCRRLGYTPRELLKMREAGIV